MRNKCECGTIFEFSEKTIGSTITCQNCDKEIVLEDPRWLRGDIKQKAFQLSKFGFLYIIFFSCLLVALIIKDGDPQRQKVLSLTLSSQSTNGDPLRKQAKKILNQVKLQNPRSTGKWSATQSEGLGHWIVKYEISNSAGYPIFDAIFEVIMADQFMISPLNELAVVIQGDFIKDQMVLDNFKKRTRTLPKMDTSQLLKRMPKTADFEGKLSKFPQLLKKKKKR